ncbi:hypothetical protein ACGTJS_01910 [Faucicola mancuniensis]|uniref:hypothetical protein n=1 Tax=Faucicola mancuniensis TaxID=1309795 RepID=UPI0028EFDFA3|nr:hypothetical protein [uncultured Moraxella sp.]
MADTDIDDSFEDDNFDDDEDARLADDDVTARGRGNSLEKRLLIDNFLAEKRLERSLKDSFDDDLDRLDDLDDDDDF